MIDITSPREPIHTQIYVATEHHTDSDYTPPQHGDDRVTFCTTGWLEQHGHEYADSPFDIPTNWIAGPAAHIKRELPDSTLILLGALMDDHTTTTTRFYHFRPIADRFAEISDAELTRINEILRLAFDDDCPVVVNWNPLSELLFVTAIL